MQQKMAESEAEWIKTIEEKAAAMANVTAEKEGFQREVEQLKSPVKVCMNCTCDFISI